MLVGLALNRIVERGDTLSVYRLLPIGPKPRKLSEVGNISDHNKGFGVVAEVVQQIGEVRFKVASIDAIDDVIGADPDGNKIGPRAYSERTHLNGIGDGV